RRGSDAASDRRPSIACAPSGVAPGPDLRVASLAADRAGELLLGHLGATRDVPFARLVVELLLRPTAGPSVRPQAAAPARRDVVGRDAARGLRLAVPGALLVDRSRRDLFGGVLVLAAFEQAFLDVLVLAIALVTPLRSGHGTSPRRSVRLRPSAVD